MTDHLVTSVVSVLMAIIGVAIIAVLVSRNSQTSNVLSAGGNAFSRILGTAISPTTGSGLGLGLGSFTGGGTGIGLNIGG